jgi:hypothetical protein
MPPIIPTHGPNYSKLKSTLNSSKLQKDNIALFQTVSELIKGTQSFQSFVNSTFGQQQNAFNNITAGLGSINGTLNEIVNAASQIVAHLKLVDNEILALQSSNINTFEVDTSGGPVTIDLSVTVIGFTSIKDITGNAGVNNISFIQTIDGGAPVISSNFGVLHVYLSGGSYFTW